FAGGTANMEAQSLSGLPMVNYSSNISTINSDVFPSMPFIPSIVFPYIFLSQTYDRDLSLASLGEPRHRRLLL
ncbi:hypothetical protein, partial [Lactococcus petauri]|uniref:hypothetical protein n=1 Tax=Lactococcus petauri TaxID=1940789 RepID=UPI0023EAE499